MVAEFVRDNLRFIVWTVLIFLVISYPLVFGLGYSQAMQDKEQHAQLRFVEMFLWAVQTDLITVNSNRLRGPDDIGILGVTNGTSTANSPTPSD